MITSVKENEKFNKMGFVYNNINLFIGLFIFCLVLRDMGGLPLNKFVFIGIASLLFAFCDENRMVVFIAFITPLSLGISYSFITLIAIFFLLIKRKGRVDLDFGAVFFFVIIVIELLNMFYPDSSLVDFFRSINILAFLVLLFLDKQRKYNHQMILKHYLYGFCVLSMFTFFWIYKFGSIANFFKYGTTLGEEIVRGVEGNKIFAGNNSMGLYAVISIAVGMLLFYTNKANKLFLIISVSLGFIMGFISTSRGFVFSMLLCLFLFMFLSIKSTKAFLKALIISILMFFIAFLLINTILKESYVTFMNKMKMADFSNGRVEVFQNYLEFFISNIKVIFIGVGMQDYQIKCGQFEYQSIHNAVQEVLIMWGTVGLISVVGFFVSLYKSAIAKVPKKQRNVIYLIPSIIYLFYVQFNQLFTVTSVTMLITVVYSSIALNSEQSIHIEKRSEQHAKV